MLATTMLLSKLQAKQMNKKTLLQIAIGPIIVIGLHSVGTLAGWSEMWWWFDIPMHFLGGVAIAISIAAILHEFETKKKFNIAWKPLEILTLLAFVALAAVLWEMMEFAFDIFFHTDMQPSLLDTIKDMCMGIIGGGLSAIVLAFRRK